MDLNLTYLDNAADSRSFRIASTDKDDSTRGIKYGKREGDTVRGWFWRVSNMGDDFFCFFQLGKELLKHGGDEMRMRDVS